MHSQFIASKPDNILYDSVLNLNILLNNQLLLFAVKCQEIAIFIA